MSILDELERLSKEASRGDWSCREKASNLFSIKNDEGTICDVATWYDGELVTGYTRTHAELIVLMRNNIDALIQVARASEYLLDHVNRDYAEWKEPLEKALEKLK